MDGTNKVDRRGRRRRSLFTEMFLGFVAIDILVGFLLVAMWLLSFDTRDLAVALPLSVGLFALRFGAWAGFLYRGLEPVRTWQQDDIREDEQTLLAVEQHLFRLPRRLNAVLAAGWGAYFIALPLLMWFGFPEAVAIGPGELPACVLQVLTVIVGAYAIYSQLSKVLIDHTLARIARALDPSKHRRLRDRVSLAPRMLWTGFALIVGPSAWLASLAWLETVHTARDLAVAEARADVDAAARVLEAGPESGRSSRPLEVVFVDPQQLPPDQTGNSEHIDGLDVRQERAWAATRLADGRWISSQRDVELPLRRGGIILLLYIFAALIWGLTTIYVQTRVIMGPVLRLRNSARQLVEVGEVASLERLPVIDNDEIGDLTGVFNQVYATYAQLTQVAGAIAEGDLTVEISGKGDMPEAFRRMIDRLHDVVIQLRVTTLTVSAAIDDIDYATKAQEHAAIRQIEEIGQLEASMLSLAGSATQIESASGNVLGIAERTLVDTDEMAGRIRVLSAHNSSIETMLDLIREIAERSDLLALNGSLEATRAGEAGRGFALVAAEMRRLA
ncbi:MAG: methyl-accepting chemotaxis protein, partial [Myxococcales bacterium]|nr:methyl-accepting chemotaxis protein [Myxococcales bacterium]